MKKSIIIMAIVALAASACTYKVCPTYAKQDAAKEAKQAERL